MKNGDDFLKILIVDPSVIVRTGLSVVLKRMPGYWIQPIEINSIENLEEVFELHKPDILIISPSSWGLVDMQKIRENYANSQLKVIALLSSMYSDAILKRYDESINIYDDAEHIKTKLDKLMDSSESKEEMSAENDSLSSREKEILVLVVRGMTNKEIAEKLFLSTHTVITHRRNIVRKLEIHSTAGLTVYAIVNKLVKLDEIKNFSN
ncbi:response regulator transcription factor [Paludibacteraceae bacterium OttesenSCG-928-F17]|nr:response regulator transcription factor [Paludibacteraceae bacterium OttesenSCG-928-F17]